MGIFGKAKDEARKLEEEHSGAVSQASEKAEPASDGATHGKFASQIQSVRNKFGGHPAGRDAAQGQAPSAGPGPAQGQGQYQVPSQSQDPEQNQDRGQNQ